MPRHPGRDGRAPAAAQTTMRFIYIIHLERRRLNKSAKNQAASPRE